MISFESLRRAVLRSATAWLLLLAQFVAWTVFADPGIHLHWKPSRDPRTSGYTVAYGTSSRAYTAFLDVGNATNAIVSGLASGQTYYFSVHAYGPDGLQSNFANEVVCRMTELMGETTGQLDYGTPGLIAGRRLQRVSGKELTGLIIQLGTIRRDGELQIVLRISHVVGVRLLFSRELADREWHPVPAAWIVGQRQGEWLVRLPPGACEDQCFFRMVEMVDDGQPERHEKE